MLKKDEKFLNVYKNKENIFLKPKIEIKFVKNLI